MPKINVLSMDVANLIAAGEVVDRPASVLKELIENSIDAGATSVTAEIKHGGIEFIRVSDNGCGISTADMPLAIKRHATSKIRSREDLASILTLGFRGEALAAISSVSRIRIMSKEKNSENGAMLVCDYGEISDVSEAGCPNGTTIVVEELFSNLPARRKFLKKDTTEAMAVAATVEKVALSRPDVAIKLIIDGNVKFATIGDGDLKNAVYALFGREFASKLIALDYKSGNIGVKGYIGRSDNIRANRSFQNFFINGRYIRSRTAQAALEQAYTSFIAPEKFPCCVLTIEIDPSLVDVNVHPAKLEVKFSDERAVFEAVYYAVRNALQDYSEKPELEMPKRKSVVGSGFANAQNAFSAGNVRGEQMKFASSSFTYDKKDGISTENEIKNNLKKDDFFKHVDLRSKLSDENEKIEWGAGTAPISNEQRFSAISSCEVPKATMPKDEGELPLSERLMRTVSSDDKNVDAPEASAQAAEKSEVCTPCNTEILPEYKLLGVAFNCYILVQVGEKLLVIDKHAAHERILFEKLKKNCESREVLSQCLLIPIKIQLDDAELSAVIEYRQEILACGFDYGVDRDAKTAILSQIPREIGLGMAEDAFLTMTERLASGTGDAAITRALLFEKALYQTACKAAVKGGRTDTAENIDWIVQKVLALPDITVCPHGRPIAVEMTHSYLDRQFERDR